MSKNKSYNELLAEDRRLCILRLLEKAPGATLNNFILQSLLDNECAHVASNDMVRGDLFWLAEQGLARLEEGPALLATLTPRGEDAALGRCRVPGVKKPVAGA